MLQLLHIENIAVIERSEITFDSGFNVLTGETGAGKSIVIDAISAILGERAYRDMIRTGAQKASVRGVFTDVPEFPWFQENGVTYDSETIIQREIYLDGKNVCRVNGSLVTVSILRKLGIQLINIHGQHDSASLFDENNQNIDIKSSNSLHAKFLSDITFSDNDYVLNYLLNTLPSHLTLHLPFEGSLEDDFINTLFKKTEEIKENSVVRTHRISLGRRILRTETAGLATLSMLIFCLDE